ncbi:unnamed protein product [Effrenium voratum]|nr:unnamed protein product [Effrenium voratum]
MALAACGLVAAALAGTSLQGCGTSSPSPPPAAAMPKLTLRNGVQMPVMAAGTWQYNDSVAEDVVLAAFKAGFTHIDTAYDYGNQVGVGKGLQKSGKARDTMFITSKVPGCGLQNVSALTVEKCKTETEDKVAMDLQQLNLSYLDLVLLHFPPCPGEDGTPKGPTESKCYAPRSGCTHPQACDMIQAQWGVLTEFYQQKKLRAIGVSNYCSACFQCLASAKEQPMVNQVQMHVGMGSDPQGFRSFAQKHQVALQAYSPFGSGGHGSEEILKGNLTTAVAKKYGKSAAQIALKWIVSRNISVATKSSNPEHLKANLGIFDFSISDADMKSLDEAAFASQDTPSFLCNDPQPALAEPERVIV